MARRWAISTGRRRLAKKKRAAYAYTTFWPAVNAISIFQRHPESIYMKQALHPIAQKKFHCINVSSNFYQAKYTSNFPYDDVKFSNTTGAPRAHAGDHSFSRLQRIHALSNCVLKDAIEMRELLWQVWGHLCSRGLQQGARCQA